MGLFQKLFRKKKPYYTKEGYKQVWDPENPMARSNGYVPEHRKRASEKIGRPLRSGEIVHHVDGNKKNNKKSNLQVMLSSEHPKIHFGERKKQRHNKRGRDVQ